MDTGRLAKVTWHSCRYTFASRLVLGGVDPRTVMELGDWCNVAMVQRYSHPSPDHLRTRRDLDFLGSLVESEEGDGP
jgi:site-specific recombinase XerD